MKNVVFIVLALFILSCGNKKQPQFAPIINQDSIDRVEDSLEFLEDLSLKEKIQYHVTADFETDPVKQEFGDDAADDPAIWYDKENWENSKIIGTDKKHGLAVYDLNGKELFYHDFGKVNNVDLRYDFPLVGQKVDILVGSNRTYNSLDIYTINRETGELSDVSARRIEIPRNEIDDVYGICMYKSKDEKFYAIINGKNGMVQQYELFEKDGKIDARKIRQHKFQTQVEGMVADDEHGYIYVGEETLGIWKMKAEPDSAMKPVFVDGSDRRNLNIVYDVEGLTIYTKPDGEGYLLMSSQGNFSYAVFERTGDNKYLGSFSIVDAEIDGTEETDGIDVTASGFGNRFPKGIFIAQDGYNFDGEAKKPQNFKVVDWRKIEKVIEKFDVIEEIE